MGKAPEIPSDWTATERWVWEQIAAGERADLNTFGPDRVADSEPLDPRTEQGWGEERRLSAKFLQTILTQRAFVEATPHGGVRIFGALIDDAPLDLEHARLPHHFWLEKSRILVDVKSRNLRVDGELSFEQCFVASAVALEVANIQELTSLQGATFKSGLNLTMAKIGTNLAMNGSTFEGEVSLNGVTVGGVAFLNCAIFKSALDITTAKIGTNLQMGGSTFEGEVILDSVTVGGSAFLRSRATFKSDLNLMAAKIGTNLDMGGSIFEGAVNLTGSTITGDFILGISDNLVTDWKDGASLTLRNTHAGALQDWWRDKSINAWPNIYRLEGFTYERLGSTSVVKEADMLDRPVNCYLQWLEGDPGSSPQPHEQLARRFHDAGQPHKASEVLYAARERRRRKAWAKVDDHGNPKKRKWPYALGLLALRMTIGYGLGGRYFRVLWWVGGLTLVGTLVLMLFGSHPWAQWLRVFFASLDQLLPIITLNKAHDAMIFGDASAKPPCKPQPYGVLIYFYVHKIAGWVLGSFIVAGLAGLTQRN